MPADGRIPFAFRIGVTGHRRLDDLPALTAAVRKALDRILSILDVSPATPLVPVVVSALAEGADRLVAREALAHPGCRLDVALPFPSDQYLDDFDSEPSKQEFRELLGRASEVWQASETFEPDDPNREVAYERAGRFVVDRCDVLIALWDGLPSQGRGGTAEIVAYAREREVPLVWVKTGTEPSVIDELGRGAAVLAEAAHELDQYNASPIPPDLAEAHGEVQHSYWGVEASDRDDVDRMLRRQAAGWLVPYFVRADLLALRFQRRFQVMSAAVFVMASAAVAVVATQAKFFPDRTWIVGFESVFLLGILAILGLSLRWHLHDRWIAYRFMAERLRSLYFLTLAGTGDRRERSGRLAYLSDPSEVWIERALTEVGFTRPRGGADPDVGSLRRYLARFWIGDQRRYHEKASRLHRSWDERLIRATAVLFVVTLVASFLHLGGVGGHGERESNWGAFLVVLAVVVPVIGAAAHGIGTQRQYRRHSDRYARMAGLLGQLQEDMERASSLDEIKRVARDTERIMREENSDWFGVMRFQDMELIT